MIFNSRLCGSYLLTWMKVSDCGCYFIVTFICYNELVFLFWEKKKKYKNQKSFQTNARCCTFRYILLIFLFNLNNKYEKPCKETSSDLCVCVLNSTPFQFRELLTFVLLKPTTVWNLHNSLLVDDISIINWPETFSRAKTE